MFKLMISFYVQIRNLSSPGVLCQEEELEDYTKTLCSDKRNEELFRLQTGKHHCRDVVQCTDAVRLI